ncbi:adenosylcobinamide amidohydrolase [Halobellus salinus]|uniref:Adenosylcobinamide amidohydrolase n=1 Tax=Halobellus salinus TaxID=931585 RepID=A0A830ECV4_9EURY|nr:adenosylcobinamide amidohydrolase [Halobellus salinus]GGJ11708.1 adenosylcobinamide amidohydrolase [Halobellus salinus]SMP03252.1 adenosylcobinamide hydrolase [Halobellus salinus]
MTGSDRGDDADPTPVFEATVRGEVCRLRRPGTRWVSTGHAGGECRCDAAFLLSVPERWGDVDIPAYVRERCDAAGFATGPSAPALLTGVSMRHARRARLGPVEAIATAGVSNPAALPVGGGADGDVPEGSGGGGSDTDRHHTGTVNVVVGTTRSLAPGALPNLVAVAAEAKAATLLARVGVPGTTSDAVAVGCDPEGETAAFSGSATPVGSAARVCVRDAVAAALDARYEDESPPTSVDAAEYGVVSDARARVERVGGRE